MANAVGRPRERKTRRARKGRERVEAYIAQNEGEMTLKENLELTQTSKTRTDDIMEKGDNNTTLREQEQRGEQLLYEIAVKLSNKGK